MQAEGRQTSKAGKQAVQGAGMQVPWGWKATLTNWCPEGDPCVALYEICPPQGDSCVRKISEAKGNPGFFSKTCAAREFLHTQEKEGVKGDFTPTVFLKVVCLTNICA